MLLSPSNQTCRKSPVPEEDYEIWLKAPQKLVREPWVKCLFVFGQITLFAYFCCCWVSQKKTLKNVTWQVIEIYKTTLKHMMKCEELNRISCVNVFFFFFISEISMWLSYILQLHHLMTFLHSGADHQMLTVVIKVPPVYLLVSSLFLISSRALMSAIKHWCWYLERMQRLPRQRDSGLPPLRCSSALYKNQDEATEATRKKCAQASILASKWKPWKQPLQQKAASGLCYHTKHINGANTMLLSLMSV